MIAPHPCIVYTQDESWRRRINGFLGLMCNLRHANSGEKLEKLLAQSQPALLLFDLRAEGSRDLLPLIAQAWPATSVVALGIQRSDPMREAASLGVFAVEDLMADRARVQALAAQALDHIDLVQENQALREQRTPARAQATAAASPPCGAESRSARLFASALRNVGHIDDLLQRSVEGIAAAMLVMRAGVFARTRSGQGYRLRAGLRCPDEVRALQYEENHPLVRWLDSKAQLVSHISLEHLRNPADARWLRPALEETGADAIVPLIGADHLLGWVFVGPRSTGLPFVQADFEDLLSLTEPVATALENAMVFDEATVQKTLLETLLNSLPTGIIAVEADGRIRWCNRAATNLLDAAEKALVGQPIESLGTRTADGVQRALRGEEAEEAQEWTLPSTKRALRLQAFRLADAGRCLGAVALVQDITVENVLQEKEQGADRAAFWAELAASMSHEIRNPLVAIRTFAQLLPERYADPDFREEFSELVTREVDRLNAIVDQINRFAYPPSLEFRALDIRHTVQKGLNLAMVRHPENGIRFEIAMDEDLPRVAGDESALSECFAHLFSNAMEAVARRQSPRVILTARRTTENGDRDAVLVTVKDNGAGIPATIRSKVFSPFCTTKARGMGLGLPIVKRTVTDHNGRIQIDTDPTGTSVSVILPVQTANTQ